MARSLIAGITLKMWLWAFATVISLAFGEPMARTSDSLTTAESVNFCDDPVGAICPGGGDAVRKDRLKYIEEFKTAAREKFKDQPRDESSVRKLLRETTKPQFDHFLKADLPKIRDSMILAIKKSPLPPAKKKEFTQHLDGETVHSFVDLFENKNGELMSRGVAAFSACGPEGLRPLAQAEDTEKARADKKQRIILCDSLFLREGLKPEGALAAGFMVAAHEMAHVMSAYWEPAMYNRLRNCMTSSYGRSLVGEYLQALKSHGQTVDESYVAQIYAHQDRFVNIQMEEISADYWARKAIGSYLLNANMSKSEKLNFLRGSYGYFCGAENRGMHPSGRFRVQFMGQDSVIRRALGCKPAVPAACEL